MPPFIWIRGRLFIVANWAGDMPEDAWLLLRPASQKESDNYLDRIGNAEEEAYFTAILNDEDRTSGR